MWLRWLVSRYVRQAAQHQVRQVIAGAAQQAAGQQPEPAEEAAQRPPCSVAVVFALPIESGGLVDLLKGCVTERRPSSVCHIGSLDDRTIMVVESNAGSAAAAQACADVIAIDHPAWVISAGFAGGLHEDLARGHILMADQVIDLAGQQLSTGLHVSPQDVSATPNLHVGKLLTVDHIVRRPQEKRELGSRFESLACDMESMGVAEACRRLRTRFLAVRVISDAVDDELPRHLEKLLDQKSLAGKLGAATGALLQRPSRVKELWALREQALKASDRLATFLKSLVTQLPV